MIRRVHGWAVETFRLHWKRTLLFIVGGVLIPLTIAQFVYPNNTLLPFTSIEGVSVSGWNKQAAIELIDSRYSQTPIAVYFGADNLEPYRIPKPADIGIGISNEARVNAMGYPWYLRLAPGSLWWGHFVVKAADAPNYTRDDEQLAAYVETELNGSCVVEPRNAQLKVVGDTVVVEEGTSGGTCDIDEVRQLLAKVDVRLSGEPRVDIPVTVIPANINNTEAERIAAQINNAAEQGVAVSLGDNTTVIPRQQLMSWLDFSYTDSNVDYSFNADRANTYLIEQLAPKVAIPAGVTTITTYDFVETSRQTGASGRTLDVAATLTGIQDYMVGRVVQATVVSKAVAPTIQYVRNYSPTYEGLAALMENFATARSGVYGVALTELSGEYRRAAYNSTQSFVTASTYKLYVAYSTLLRIESGAWKWTDQIQGGRDLAKCFDDMIVVSDNACARTLLEKIGFTTITNEVHAIGCINTSFLGNDGIKTTAEDLALLLAQLQTGQILEQQSSRDILINAMKRNIYRQGIPKGINAVVADKVGFLDGLLHDAAIVYASTGPYVLVILTDGSSWADIAQLTREIEALRLQ